LAAQPEVEGLVRLRDELRAMAERGADAAMLAHQVWRRRLTGLVASNGDNDDASDERALDALVAFLDALGRHVDRNPALSLGDVLASIGARGGLEADPGRVGVARAADAVTVTTIAAAAGREWHTVVVAGCVEGELPSV